MTATISASCATRFVSKYDSPYGMITLVADDESLVGLYFPAQLDSLPGRESWLTADKVSDPDSAKHPKGSSGYRGQTSYLHDVIDDVQSFLNGYFARSGDCAKPNIRLIGTPFQLRVWDELITIPFGQTRTYGEIAKAIGKPTASRAVGKAIGDNPISIIVPCHRVIGANGSLTGYAGGIEIKRRLLKLESAV